MDIKRKIEIVQQAVASISDHGDADSVVLLQALELVQQDVAQKMVAVRERAAAQAREALGKPAA